MSVCSVESSSQKTHIFTHSSEKGHDCSLCEKAFLEAGDLKKHQRSHTGEKRFDCHHCEMSFLESGNLVIHIINNHG